MVYCSNLRDIVEQAVHHKVGKIAVCGMGLLLSWEHVFHMGFSDVTPLSSQPWLADFQSALLDVMVLELVMIEAALA